MSNGDTPKPPDIDPEVLQQAVEKQKAEDNTRSFLDRAKEQLARAAQRGVEGFIQGLGGEVTGGGLLGMAFQQSSSTLLEGTMGVGDATKIRQNERIQPLPFQQRVPNISLSFSRIRTGLGMEVDRVLQKSQDETVTAITQTWDVMKDRIYGLQKTVTVLDKNIRIVDIRTKRLQSDVARDVDALQKELKRLGKKTDDTGKLLTAGLAEKKESETAAGTGGSNLLDKLKDLGKTALYTWAAIKTALLAGGAGLKGIIAGMGPFLPWIAIVAGLEIWQRKQVIEFIEKNNLQQDPKAYEKFLAWQIEEHQKSRVPGLLDKNPGNFTIWERMTGGWGLTQEEIEKKKQATLAEAAPEKMAVEQTTVNLTAKETILIRASKNVSLTAQKITIEAADIIFKGRVHGLPEAKEKKVSEAAPRMEQAGAPRTEQFGAPPVLQDVKPKDIKPTGPLTGYAMGAQAAQQQRITEAAKSRWSSWLFPEYWGTGDTKGSEVLRDIGPGRVQSGATGTWTSAVQPRLPTATERMLPPPTQITGEVSEYLKERISSGEATPQEIAEAAHMETQQSVTGLRETIISREPSTMMGPGAPGIPETPGIWGMMGRGAEALSSGAAALGARLGGWFGYGGGTTPGHGATGSWGGREPTSGGKPGYASGGGGAGQLSIAQLTSLAKQAGANEKEAAVLAAIAMAESSGNPGAMNPRGRDYSFGLWQINMKGNMGPQRMKQFGLSKYEDLYDPLTNAKAALALYRARGNFGDWSTYNDGKYRNWLGTAQEAARTSPSIYTPSASSVGGVYTQSREQLSAEQRKSAPGGRVVSLDYNSTVGGKGGMIIIPNDATAEEKRAAQNYANNLKKYFADRGYANYDVKIKTTAENGRGIEGFFHTEPFYAQDKQAVDIIKSDPGGYAAVLKDSLGTLPGVKLIPPHEAGAPGSKELGGVSEREFALSTIIPELQKQYAAVNPAGGSVTVTSGTSGPTFRTTKNEEVGKYIGFERAVQGLSPEMQARLMAAYNDMPDDVKKSFIINEGWRSREYQQYLWNTRSGRGLVGRPGRSRHEGGGVFGEGKAVDVDSGPALDWLHRYGSKYGLTGIGSGDYPHIQMDESGRHFYEPGMAGLPVPGQAETQITQAEPTTPEVTPAFPQAASLLRGPSVPEGSIAATEVTSVTPEKPKTRGWGIISSAQAAEGPPTPTTEVQVTKSPLETRRAAEAYPGAQTKVTTPQVSLKSPEVFEKQLAAGAYRGAGATELTREEKQAVTGHYPGAGGTEPTRGEKQRESGAYPGSPGKKNLSGKFGQDSKDAAGFQDKDKSSSPNSHPVAGTPPYAGDGGTSSGGSRPNPDRCHFCDL